MAHRSPGAGSWIFAKNDGRSVDTRATPTTVTPIPISASPDGRSPRKTIASNTPTTAYPAPIGETTATGPSSSPR